jgi:hypothetical protein
MKMKPTRRAVVAGLAGAMTADVRAFAQNLTMPSSPVTLNFVDVAGNLALTQKAIEAWRDKIGNTSPESPSPRRRRRSCLARSKRSRTQAGSI